MAENLNAELKKSIEISEKNISVIEAEIDKAKRIGLDVVELETRLKRQKSQVALVKEVYNL